MAIDNLRSYYQDELRALREDAARFAATYPKIAPMLGLAVGETADPMAERLIESMAWFAARIRRDSEELLPLAAQHILGNLYPNFVNPIPSVSLAQLTPEPGLAGSFPDGVEVPAHTGFTCQSRIDGTTLHWRTGWPMRLHHVTVEEVEILTRPPVGLVPRTPDATAFLRLALTPPLAMRSIRLFLNGDSYRTYPLHEGVFFNLDDVFIASRAGGYAPLGRNAVRPGGLEGESVLPEGEFALPGYHILQEFFICPERFLFWDLGPFRGHDPERKLEIVIALRQHPGKDLDLSPKMFATNVVPVVNLFEKLAEPIYVDHRSHCHRLVPDQRRRDACEVHSILSVEALTPGGAPRPIAPYFAMTGDGIREDGLYWYGRRRCDIGDAGTYLDMYFKDPSTRLGESRPFTALARVLCTNRGRASGLGASAALLHNTDLPIAETRLVRPPTPQHRPPMLGDELCKLVSGISLHPASLSGANGAKALRQLLRLYSPPGDAVADRQINGLVNLEAYGDVEFLRPTRQLPLGGVAQGMEFRVQVRRDAFRGSSIYVFGSVLDIFLGLNADINSFTRLKLHTTEHRKAVYAWPARNGLRAV
ncbi:MAG: type VI secretion system baseplate subunit TssF [Planctomycetaceae bacterium]|nr:type VI secretion system baseplate subunit TssF [Planctomycetaceae bacterium]